MRVVEIRQPKNRKTVMIGGRGQVLFQSTSDDIQGRWLG